MYETSGNFIEPAKVKNIKYKLIAPKGVKTKQDYFSYSILK